MSRRWLLVAGVVALAGCASLTGGGTDTAASPGSVETTTPTVEPASTAEPTATPTPAAEPTPTLAATPTVTPTPATTATPGETADERVERQIEAHRTAVGNYDYDLTRYRFERATTAEWAFVRNVSVQIRSSAVSDRVVGESVETRSARGNTSVTERDVFVAVNVSHRRVVRQTGRTQFSNRTVDSTHQRSHEVSAANVVQSIVETARYENASTVERDGRTLHRYELVALREGYYDGDLIVENASGYYFVDREGIIHEARLTYDLSSPDSETTKTVGRYFEVEIADRLTVERPGWVDRA